MHGSSAPCRARVACHACANAAVGDSQLPIHIREAKRSVRIWERPNSPTYLLSASSKLLGVVREDTLCRHATRARPRASE